MLYKSQRTRIIKLPLFSRISPTRQQIIPLERWREKSLKFSTILRDLFHTSSIPLVIMVFTKLTSPFPIFVNLTYYSRLQYNNYYIKISNHQIYYISLKNVSLLHIQTYFILWKFNSIFLVLVGIWKLMKTNHSFVSSFACTSR